jgi:hypothetical protein
MGKISLPSMSRDSGRKLLEEHEIAREKIRKLIMEAKSTDPDFFSIPYNPHMTTEVSNFVLNY